MDVTSFFTLFTGICFLTVLVFLWKGFPGAPWVPTRKRELDLLLDHLSLQEGDIFVDLGCGNGTILFAVLKKFPQVHVRGYEVFIIPYLLAKVRSWFSGGRAKIYLKNIFLADITQADVVYCYLLPDMFPKLRELFKKQLHRDASVIMSAWPLPQVTPAETWRSQDVMPYYVYTKENLIS